ERLTRRVLCNFVEVATTDAAVFLSLLLFLFATGAIFAQFFGQVRGDGLALAVGDRGEIDSVRTFRQLLQTGDDFLLARHDDVICLENVVYVAAQRAIRQIFIVSERR